ncbi:outer membrane beta-barrel protein [Sediminicola arcticus]|jgi:hypothetical protein|uniref:Outer membrane beta-barrel protein n=1 Tax=Sediminicola arcticus TaxID=1574308 RepID=A0ABV2SR14_9FLAO
MKKNLDNLFQEKLTDLHELPNDKVWKSIETSLDTHSKSRRIVPLWWTIGGVAALVAILFYIVQPNATDLNINTIITDTEQRNLEALEVVDENEDRNLEIQKGTLTNTEISEKSQNKPKDGLTGTKNEENAWTSTSTENQSTPKTNNRVSNNVISTTQNNKKEKAIAPINLSDPSKMTGQTAKGNIVAAINESLKKNTPAATILDTDNNKNILSPHSLNSEALEIAGQEPKNNGTLSDKKSVYDEINTEEKDKAIVAANSNKWSVEPSVAPVYFNGFGSGSSIHPEFTSNSKSGNVNLSYGVFVSYEVSKKLSVRSGVHKVDYGYNTNDVAFTSSFAAANNSSLTNISYSANASNIIVVSTSNTKPASNIQGEISGKTPSRNGSMIQQFGYLEIPLELNYALLDKDFGISLVGGFSSLFLTNNAVILEADGLNTQIGEANNINDINFSSNIGFGLNYKFTPKIKLNIEPVFKYHLNTFSNTAGDFNPFSIGIYSGFNFKF